MDPSPPSGSGSISFDPSSGITPPGPSKEQSSRPRKIKRISKACDFCHGRSIRCSASAEDPSRCQSCVEYEQACTYNRPTKKRGAKSGKNKITSPPTPGGSISGRMQGDEQWQAPNIAPQALIMDLVEVYFEVIYPVYPLYHRPTLMYRVSRGEWQTSRPFFATIMALCALSSSRVRDGALYSNRWHPKSLAEPSSETFYRAAEDALPNDTGAAARELDYLRACAFLSLAALQNGRIKEMHYYLGYYATLIKCEMLHDEKHWSMPMDIVQKEERRRLFWAMYMFEVYAAAVWGSVVNAREAQTSVHYPAEVDDDFLTTMSNEDSGTRVRTTSTTEAPMSYTLNNWNNGHGSASWLQGWNFAIDLYRVLEHALDGFRKRSPDTDHTKFVADVWKMKLPLQSEVLDNIMHKYENLPVRFRQTLPISFNQKEDLFSFQAANIAAAIQLVRMTLITSAEASPLERCDILAELVTTFARVPVAYLRAMSTPILHHLAGIGVIVESVFEEPVNEECYDKVRQVLIALADLLSSLESGMGAAAGASDRLRSQVHRMDGYMQVQRQQHITRQGAPPHSQTGERHSILPQNQGPPLQGPGSGPHDENHLLGPHAGVQQPNQEYFHAQNNNVPYSESFYSFPAEIFEDWNWAFDFTQTARPFNGGVMVPSTDSPFVYHPRAMVPQGFQ